MNLKTTIFIFAFLAICILMASCSSMPLPEGWETENTKNRKLEIDLLEKQLAEENAKPEPKGKCESIMAPIRGSSDIAIATYYTAMAGCTGGLGDPALLAESQAVQLSNEFESTRREKAKNKTALARIFTDGILGVARMGVDIEIAKDNRESNEKIAKYSHDLALKELENPGKGAIWVTDGGVYTTNEGSNNPITEDNDVTTTTTTTTDSRDLSTVDSHDDYSQDNDQTTTTTEDNDQTTTTTEDNDVTETTTTTDSNDQTTTNNDNRVTPAPNVPDPEAGGPDSEETTTTRAPSNTPNPFEDTCAGKFNTVECWAHYYDWERSLVDAAPFCNSQVPTDVAMCTKKLGDIDTLEEQRELLIRTGSVRTKIPGAN